MTDYNPIYALLIFILSALLLYFIFRPTKGWFWLIRNSFYVNQKVVIEDILKLVYHYENSGKEVNVNSITRSLPFSNQIIIDVIHKMTNKKLIYFDGDLVKLTGSGRDYSLRIVRVHRLWEKYLAEKTGFDKSEWHDRAEQMEHKLSQEETDSLASQLGNPVYDPHGDPIPTTSGKVAKIKGVALSSLPVDTVGRISHIEDEPDIIYKQIIAENIHIGSQIRVVENNSKRVVFYSEGEEFKLAPIVAANLTVAKLKKDVTIDEDTTKLSSLKKNETAVIVGISRESRGEKRRRLLDLGFVKGTPIRIDLMSPFNNPTAYLVKGTSIALRKDQASKILIKKDQDHGK
jgi:DtxR family Mn-dependent transcriptional regulator